MNSRYKLKISRQNFTARETTKHNLCVNALLASKAKLFVGCKGTSPPCSKMLLLEMCYGFEVIKLGVTDVLPATRTNASVVRLSVVVLMTGDGPRER